MLALSDGYVHPTGKPVNVSNPPRVQSDIKPVTHSHMGERLPYYILTYPRSPVTGRFKATTHHVPDAHLDD